MRPTAESKAFAKKSPRSRIVAGARDGTEADDTTDCEGAEDLSVYVIS
jgi:hypothetical protein